MNTYAERLKYAMKIRDDMSQTELARRIGVRPQAIQYLCKKGVQSVHTVDIANALNISAKWLADGSGSIENSIDGEIIKKEITYQKSNAEWLGAISEWDNETPLDDDEVAIPFFREVELSAGNGKTHIIENHGNKLRFSKSTLKKAGVEIANAYCVMAKGNSMANVIPDGSTVGVDVGFKRIVDGKIYAIDHDGQLRIKIIYRLPGGGIRLKSYNEDEWPDEFYPTEPNNKITILGRVFWYSALLY